MSIPRIAINRPVTMFMLSGVIVLLGAISLLRLPVDLMPELQLPSVTIRVNYPGVGPREIEESITRPLEQAVSAVAGLEQVNATSAEGSSVILPFSSSDHLNRVISKRSAVLLPLRSVTSPLVADDERLTSVGVTVKLDACAAGGASNSAASASG